MKHEKIQIVPPNALKTKWSRAIRYGDLIFTTAHSAARPDGTMPTTPEEAPVWTWYCTQTASWPTGRISP